MTPAKFALPTSLLLILLTACAEPAATTITVVQPAELAARLAAGDAPVVLDVRSAEEFDAGHIPGAIHIPHTELADRLDELDVPPSAEVVVLCRSGRRAAIAEALLIGAGYTAVCDLDGHMLAWNEAGLPLEQSPAAL